MTLRQLIGTVVTGLGLWILIGVVSVLFLIGCAAPTPGIEYTGRPESYQTFGPSMSAAPPQWEQLAGEIIRPMHSAHPWREDLESLRGQPLEVQVRGVGRLLESVRFIEDRGDRWQSPDDTVQRGGDCEDHALLAMHALHHIGVTDAQLVVGATPIGDHAVLQVGPWIIDNGGTVLSDIGEFRILYALGPEGKTTYLAAM